MTDCAIVTLKRTSMPVSHGLKSWLLGSGMATSWAHRLKSWLLGSGMATSWDLNACFSRHEVLIAWKWDGNSMPVSHCLKSWLLGSGMATSWSQNACFSLLEDLIAWKWDLTAWSLDCLEVGSHCLKSWLLGSEMATSWSQKMRMWLNGQISERKICLRGSEKLSFRSQIIVW